MLNEIPPLEIYTELYSVEGAAYYIIAPQGTSNELIEEAKRFIRSHYDAVHIGVIKSQKNKEKI